MGAGAVDADAGDIPAAPTVAAEGNGWVLDNGLVRARVDARGLLTSVVDAVSGREALAPGTLGNLLQLHADTPVRFDAWDIDSYYRRCVTDLAGLGDAGSVGAGRWRRAGDPVLRCEPHHPDPHAASRRVPGRRRHRGRLAGARVAAQGGLRPRRGHRPLDGRDPVRARAPPHPRQHQLGCRPLRDLCAPVGPRRRARLRRAPSRTTRPTATTSPAPRGSVGAPPAGCGCRCCARRAAPTPSPTSARTGCGMRWCPVPASRTPCARATASTSRCASAWRRPGGRPARVGRPRRGRGGVGEVCRRRLGRRRRPALRVAGHTGAARVSPGFDAGGISLVDLLERPLGGDDPTVADDGAVLLELVRSRWSPCAGPGPDPEVRGADRTGVADRAGSGTNGAARALVLRTGRAPPPRSPARPPRTPLPGSARRPALPERPRPCSTP